MNDFSEAPGAWRGPFQRAYVAPSTSTRQTDLALPGTPPPVEQEIPISQLPLAALPFGDEQAPIVQHGITCRTPVGVIASLGVGPRSVASLVFIATQGQTIFPCSSDHYGNSANLNLNYWTQVTAGGNRLVADDGTGFGGYTLDYDLNAVILLWPAGVGEIVTVDVYPRVNQATVYVPAAIRTEALIIVTQNVIPPLGLMPDGQMTILFVNGQAFFAVTTPPDFTVSGNAITWTSTVFSVPPGANVVACYTHV